MPVTTLFYLLVGAVFMAVVAGIGIVLGDQEQSIRRPRRPCAAHIDGRRRSDDPALQVER